MTSLRHLCCAAVLVAAGVVPTVAFSSAQAQSGEVVDAAGDVSAETSGPRRSTEAPAPNDTTHDILRVDLDYRKHFVFVEVQLREVKGRGKGADVRLRLKGGGIDSEFSKLPGGRLRQYGIGVEGGGKCRGGTYVVDPGPGTVSIRVPVACIGTPDRVRFGASTVDLVDADEAGKFTLLTDDARTTGKSSEDFAPPRLGAPVRRG